MSRVFQAQVSYTYGHAIDEAATDPATAGRAFATLLGEERGDSDFDVRHYLSFSGSLGTPMRQTGVWRKVFGDWWMEWVVSARTGLPVGLRAITATPGGDEKAPQRGLFAQIRPNFTREAAWVDDAGAPGGRRLNRAAFGLPEGYEQGNLRRNLIHGFGMLGVDVSLRRQLGVGEGWRVDVLAQAFNVLNRGNFLDPSPEEAANLASASFGVARGVLYEGGVGPRSLQFGLRVEF